MKEQEMLVLASDRSVFFHELRDGTYAQVAQHSLSHDSQILGMISLLSYYVRVYH